MAFFRTWDPFDQRLVNLHTTIADVAFFELYADIDFRGRSYENALQYGFGDPVNFTSEFFGSGLAVNDDTLLPNAGTIEAFYTFFLHQNKNKWFFNLEFRDFAVPAVDLAEAMRTPDATDDAQLLARLLAGNDTIILSRGRDYFDGFDGNDLMVSLR